MVALVIAIVLDHPDVREEMRYPSSLPAFSLQCSYSSYLKCAITHGMGNGHYLSYEVAYEGMIICDNGSIFDLLPSYQRLKPLRGTSHHVLTHSILGP
jgi:hypothetical protein